MAIRAISPSNLVRPENILPAPGRWQPCKGCRRGRAPGAAVVVWGVRPMREACPWGDAPPPRCARSPSPKRVGFME